MYWPKVVVVVVVLVCVLHLPSIGRERKYCSGRLSTDLQGSLELTEQIVELLPILRSHCELAVFARLDVLLMC